MALAQGIDRRRVERLTERELDRFVSERPRPAELLARAGGSMPLGVPMGWMASLHGHPPIYLDRGEGAYVVVRAVSERIGLGSQFLMPTEDAIVVAEELAR